LANVNVTSELIGQVKFMAGQTAAASIVRTYESARDVLDKVENFTQDWKRGDWKRG
jgi:hypothetical protein